MHPQMQQGGFPEQAYHGYPQAEADPNGGEENIEINENEDTIFG